jgi:glutathione S-transferase
MLAQRFGLPALFRPAANTGRDEKAMASRWCVWLAAGLGHSAPSSFVMGATGPPSMADELPSPRQIVANVEGHPRRPAAGAPEKQAVRGGRRAFCHGS